MFGVGAMHNDTKMHSALVGEMEMGIVRGFASALSTCIVYISRIMNETSGSSLIDSVVIPKPIAHLPK